MIRLLICEKLKFYSLKDKEAFFEWLEKVDCIEDFFFKGDDLLIHICADYIHDYDLRDLLGIFYRYNIEMSQLSRFLEDDNKKWFYDNKRAFWHKKVWPKGGIQ